jgi:hypothetical protein
MIETQKALWLIGYSLIYLLLFRILLSLDCAIKFTVYIVLVTKALSYCTAKLLKQIS